jgi:hypothetical protein
MTIRPLVSSTYEQIRDRDENNLIVQSLVDIIQAIRVLVSGLEGYNTSKNILVLTTLPLAKF